MIIIAVIGSYRAFDEWIERFATSDGKFQHPERQVTIGYVRFVHCYNEQSCLGLEPAAVIKLRDWFTTPAAHGYDEILASHVRDPLGKETQPPAPQVPDSLVGSYNGWVNTIDTIKKAIRRLELLVQENNPNNLAKRPGGPRPTYPRVGAGEVALTRRKQ